MESTENALRMHVLSTSGQFKSVTINTHGQIVAGKIFNFFEAIKINLELANV